MRIIIDGDACPGISIIERIAKKYSLQVILYCDINHFIRSDYSDVRIVDSGFQSADMYIMNETKENDIVTGTIDVLDVRFGSLWTNIGRELFVSLGISYGDRVEVSVKNDTREVYRNIMIYAKSFADVHVGETLVYVNSLDNLAVAINQGSFSKAYNIQTGTNWIISIRKAPRVVYE